jgi:hypothetical protein
MTGIEMDGLFGIALKKSKTFDSTNKREFCGGNQEERCNQRAKGCTTTTHYSYSL